MSGISTNRTNITLPTEISAEIMQKTQEQSAVMSLARQIQLPGRGLTIPVITSDPEANWVDETAAKSPVLMNSLLSMFSFPSLVEHAKEQSVLHGLDYTLCWAVKQYTQTAPSPSWRPQDFPHRNLILWYNTHRWHETHTGTRRTGTHTTGAGRTARRSHGRGGTSTCTPTARA